MRLLPRFIPDDTHISFMRLRRYAVPGSVGFVVLSILLVFSLGLNLGIDFRGGTLVELRTSGPADLGRMRQILSGRDLGEVQLQNFGAENDVLIRFEKQLDDPEEQERLLEEVKQALRAVDPGVDFRRVEYVGPKVSQELMRDGLLAVLLAVFLVLVYVWFRFEWQFGAGAVIALTHDVIITVGAFTVTQYEFNLSTVAALLTIVGYSLNDTVIVYDRIRENLRRYKAIPLDELIDRSINETLSRTIMTSFTTLLALVALYLFGGEVIRSFTFAMIFGIFVGTYSSVYIAAPILVWLKVKAPVAREERAAASARP